MPEEKSSFSEHKTLNVLGSILFKLVVPVLIIISAIGFYKHQIETGPKAEQKPPKRQARLVECISVERDNVSADVACMGNVIAAQEVTLMPEVVGQINWVSQSLIPGGIVAQASPIAAIDDSDYLYALKQRQGELAQARLALKLEYGNQSLAKREYELLGEVVEKDDTDLVLRKPHLESARAALDSAQAAVEKARLDIERCKITAPFNAVVQQKHIDLGTRVSQSSPIVTLAGTDEYWVEALVPVDELVWIDIPGGKVKEGSKVKIFNQAWGNEQFRTGRVLRLIGELESRGRMARVLISIKDPLSLKPENKDKPRLLIGSFVDVRIEGRRIESVIPLSREYVRDGSFVWVMNDEELLEMRPIKTAFKSRQNVYITEGIEPGEKIVTTNIAAPVEGMPLRESSSIEAELESSSESNNEEYQPRKDR
ncbi:Multidrug transporter MdtA [Limihaloglobus sulfuriphilus]|uniref:Multidrug transporter MdtA n=1 Tax=Limihaloglobus sulfuriphilus TaxID=1851148 RepID=A0A1Q2MFV6_9BACT|nr:efflux RND transporter periplasmic adaptor subunit [Limihaloglobus sulfuriphilus]AQQ71560.1 Multidrug transporter MdtA [Limihaloglobus sulfuriphilus]